MDETNHTKPKEKNVGLQKAQEAANKVGGHMILPTFEQGASGSDWNDLVQSKGKALVIWLLKAGIDLANTKHRAQLALTYEKAQQKQQAAQALEERLEVGMGLSLSR